MSAVVSLRERFRLRAALDRVEANARFYLITPVPYRSPDHLEVFGQRCREAFAAGASLDEVAEAAGLAVDR